MKTQINYFTRVTDARIAAQKFIALSLEVEDEINATEGHYWGGKTNASMRRAALDLAALLPRLQEPM